MATRTPELGHELPFSTPLNRVWISVMNRHSRPNVGNAPVCDAGIISGARIQRQTNTRLKKLKFAGES
jgi:hypothetical protein